MVNYRDDNSNGVEIPTHDAAELPLAAQIIDHKSMSKASPQRKLPQYSIPLDMHN